KKRGTIGCTRVGESGVLTMGDHSRRPGDPQRSPIEVGSMVNPYDPPPQSTPKHRKTAPLFVASALVALIAFLISGPGILYATSDFSRRMAAGRRYATYDPELYLFGVSITPTTAQVLAFGVAPLLIALAVFLVFRGVRNRRLTPEPNADGR
ncbi:hypothetical protein SAMN06265222_1534, partial [Neorhodopirellula lusitana]